MISDAVGGLSIEMTTATFEATVALPSKPALWTGRVLSGFIGLLLALDTGFKLMQNPAAADTTQLLGYPPSSLFTIGLIEAACLILYAIPRTAALGAILWTGYLGGAIATHFRLGNPLLTHTLFPLFVAAFLWGGLVLRQPRVRAVFTSLFKG